MGDPSTPLELDRDDFESGGERGTSLPWWHCSTLGFCWHQWLPLCQRRWKVQVMSDRLPTFMSCSWRDPFVSSSTWISEEGFLFFEGEEEEREGGRQECQRALKKWVSCYLIWDLRRRSTHRYLDLPVRSWVPPKSQMLSPHIPTLCTLLNAALRANSSRKNQKLEL